MEQATKFLLKILKQFFYIKLEMIEVIIEVIY